MSASILQKPNPTLGAEANRNDGATYALRGGRAPAQGCPAATQARTRPVREIGKTRERERERERERQTLQSANSSTPLTGERDRQSERESERVREQARERERVRERRKRARERETAERQLKLALDRRCPPPGYLNQSRNLAGVSTETPMKVFMSFSIG